MTDSDTTTIAVAGPEVEAPEKKEKGSSSFLDKFLSKTGYKASDVDAWDDRKRTATTTNGGKYQMLKNGSVRTTKGPSYPKEDTGE
jgi:hypothetical protein